MCSHDRAFGSSVELKYVTFYADTTKLTNSISCVLWTSVNAALFLTMCLGNILNTSETMISDLSRSRRSPSSVEMLSLMSLKCLSFGSGLLSVNASLNYQRKYFYASHCVNCILNNEHITDFLGEISEFKLQKGIVQLFITEAQGPCPLLSNFIQI